MREAADKREPSAPSNTISDTASADIGTRNLRNLMALASALRHLALDSGPREATLYLSAAASLHRRAEKLAGLRPQRPDLEDRPEQPAPRQRVDIHI